MSAPKQHGQALRRQRRDAVEERVRQLAERNAGVPRGRPVTVGDISGYAQSGHQPCKGRGVLGIWQGDKALPCKCATKRFLKAHPEVIVDGPTGQAWWPVQVQVDGAATEDGPGGGDGETDG